MPPAIAFSCSHPMVMNPQGQHGHAISRPWIEVVVAANGKTHRVFCLLDTGADETILDLATASTLGINHLAPPQVSVTAVGGSAPSFHQESNVQLDFAGTSVTATALFGSTALPLLGRRVFLDAMNGVDVAFDAVSWHHA